MLLCVVAMRFGIKNVALRNENIHCIFLLFFPVPEVRITGAESEMHVEAGSSIALKCLVSKGLHRPKFVFWYRDKVRLVNSYTDGVTIKGERRLIFAFSGQFKWLLFNKAGRKRTRRRKFSFLLDKAWDKPARPSVEWSIEELVHSSCISSRTNQSFRFRLRFRLCTWTGYK